MGFWSNLFVAPVEPDVAVHESLLALIIDSITANDGTAQTAALGVAAVFRARQLNADIPASLPVKAGGVTLTDTQNRIMETVLSLQDNGEAYWRVDGDDFTVYNHEEIDVAWNLERTRRIYKYRERTLRTGGIAPNLVVLTVNRGAGDLTGIGWLESARLRGLIAEQLWSQQYFENNGDPTGLMEAPGNLTPDEAKLLKEQWVNRSNGVRTPAVLSGGITWKTTSFDANSSQWTDTHLIGIGDVSALSGVPAEFLAYSPPGSTVTYSNRSDLWLQYWAQTLLPSYVTRIQTAWSQILGTEVVLDPEQLLAASLGERVRAAVALVGSGFDPAESLDETGLPPIEHTGALPVTVQREEVAQ